MQEFLIRKDHPNLQAMIERECSIENYKEAIHHQVARVLDLPTALKIAKAIEQIHSNCPSDGALETIHNRIRRRMSGVPAKNDAWDQYVESLLVTTGLDSLAGTVDSAIVSKALCEQPVTAIDANSPWAYISEDVFQSPITGSVFLTPYDDDHYIMIDIDSFMVGGTIEALPTVMPVIAIKSPYTPNQDPVLVEYQGDNGTTDQYLQAMSRSISDLGLDDIYRAVVIPQNGAM